ncbi:hypothetical protein [Cypionkella sp. TWP1-2-1b2]|uniref:hypothetical protein n=1 Tax=Cypionkella sp. TWP1-2-1b2 TaxID=2804675 RepID=UPI003CF0A90D
MNASFKAISNKIFAPLIIPDQRAFGFDQGDLAFITLTRIMDQGGFAAFHQGCLAGVHGAAPCITCFDYSASMLDNMDDWLMN